MKYIVTVNAKTGYSDIRAAYVHNTQGEAYAAAKLEIEGKILDSDSMEEDYFDQGNDLEEDLADFDNDGTFVFEGFGTSLEVKVVKKQDSKAEAFVTTFES